jgi:hypothetical protein
MNGPPVVDRRIIESLVETWLPHANGRRLLLVYGRYAAGAGEFTTTAGGPRRRVRVTDQHSALGVVEAWEEHQRAHPDDDALLVVTTSVDDSELGWDVRAYAIRHASRTVDRAKIVAQRFGAVDIDPRIRQEAWVVDALLAAEPADGWPRNGSVLTLDSAIRTLIGARLGREAIGVGTLDAGALLAWSRDPAGPARFAALPRAERDGLASWLTREVGDTAAVLMRLAADGRAADAMPLGLIGAAVTRPSASPDAALAFGGLLGGTQGSELRALTEAVEGTLERWVTEAVTSRNGDDARNRVIEVVRRADALAAEARLTSALADSRFLPSAFTARLHALAAALTAQPDMSAIAMAERALDAVADHCLARLEPGRRDAARMAVRLTRWLARSESEITSVAGAIRDQMGDGAWVDSALTTVWEGDPAGDPTVGQAYRKLCEAVRHRRGALDEAFAGRLVTWAGQASAVNPGGCLLIEQVLAEVAVPLTGERAPLIVVLDGMSGAVAVEFGEQLAGRMWTEVSPVAARRVAAVAAIPSVTLASRASLLTGRLTTGEQVAEKEGFATFWRSRRRGGTLFHSGDIPGDAGHRLSDELMSALSEGDSVVGVVLDTIGHALDHGREGDRTSWSLRDVTYLPELLDAARGYGRPVLLVSDHGHVLDRASTALVDAPGMESARWRTGTPEEGEVAVTGPRVAYGNGLVVVPWREDIRYTARKAGYHGGVTLAEMTVSVLALLPSDELLPSGWHVLSPEKLTPAWWVSRPADVNITPQPPSKPARSKKPKQPVGAVPLFNVDVEEKVADSLGARVVASEVYDAQRGFVPRAPDKQVVATVIDAIVAADNRLSLSSVAALAGRSGRRPEFFVRILERLLNVDGYPVLSVVDGDRWLKLEVEMLRMQFGVGER